MGKDGERETREGRHTPPTAPRLPDLLRKSYSLIAVAYLSSCLLEPLNFIGCLHQQDKKIPYRGFGTILTQAPPEGSSLLHSGVGGAMPGTGTQQGAPASLSCPPQTTPVPAHGISCLITMDFLRGHVCMCQHRHGPFQNVLQPIAPPGRTCLDPAAPQLGTKQGQPGRRRCLRNILEGRPQHLQLGQAQSHHARSWCHVNPRVNPRVWPAAPSFPLGHSLTPASFARHLIAMETPVNQHHK